MHDASLRGRRCVLRPYRANDADELPSVAGPYDVARWMTDRFPHPYTPDAALLWVNAAMGEHPTDNYVIEVDGALAGGIGIRPHVGESAGVAEFGYWLGREYWGRGLATEAALLLAAFAFARRKLRRLEAHVFAPNIASARVLEKCGFVREAVLREAFVDREGAIVDGVLYAQLASQERREPADGSRGVFMLDHTSIGVSEFARSRAFYDAALAPLGYVCVWSDTEAAGYGLAGRDDAFAIKRTAAPDAVSSNCSHVAFVATSQAMVAAFHAAAMSHGAADEGAPALCPEYGDGYFAAFVRDPDGYRLEAVWHM